ncbi:phospholipase effector Tle1 domain-containing protein [Marinobacter sp. KMM 10035]|uniref:phospholipase effector Tle1 domain-containing protein n=1 Tax=Marinobacter sp. KMM 10035 TaxID=3134034 RepID=UPI00397A166B
MSNLIAACVGDMHVCPIKGHGSSPIMPNGSSILVEGKPIARVGDVTGCGAVITQGYPLALADGMPVAYLGSPTSHGGSIVSGNQRVILGGGTTTAPVVDFAMAGALDDKGQLTPAAKQLLDKDPQEFVRKAAQKGALIDEGLPDEEPEDFSAEEDRPKVRVEAGIFFDGTGNNRDNTQAYQRQMDECLTANAAGAISEDECSAELSQIMEGSYLNAETNVSKLERMYQQGQFQSEEWKEAYRISTYVSGVGTTSGEPDDGPSMGLGLGEQGILKKIAEGCGDLAIDIRDYVSAPIDELILDVFGFSRGAATARHFISREVQDENGALAAAFKQQGIPWPKKITVRFVGLFDTVAGVADLGNLDFSAHDAETGRINVNLRPDDAERVVQFAARDERRHNFSLNSLRGESGNLPDHFSEWALPGVHSDIGGGYPDRFHERVEVRPPLVVRGKDRRNPEASFEFSRMLQERALIKTEGWIGPLNPLATLEIEQERPPGLPGGDITLRLWLSREVRGEYSRIPLYLMHKLATDAGVPFQSINPEVDGLSLPQELMTVARNLAAHVWHGSELLMTPESRALLKQRYIHHSDHYLRLGPLYPFKPGKYGQRTIHPNEGQWIEGRYHAY